VKRWAVLVALVALVSGVAGCGSSSSGGAKASASAKPTGSGPVKVLYAGSLVNLMEKSVGPGFDKATGYDFQGEGKGSQALANEIKGKVTQGDVFVSASPAVNTSLTGAPNGGWVSWYATFGSSPLVLGYNPKSRFAADLRSKPWQQVVAESGFKLGRTDPAIDPKGKLAVQALQQAGLSGLAKGTDGVFPEETLVGRLEAGQLDAGFFYTSESTEQKIPTVTLGSIRLAATYTVTVLGRAPHQDAAVAFVRYLLGTDGSALAKQHGIVLTSPPKVTGDRSGIPSALTSTLPAG
jgi:molybdate/tungstate transport system substrate-binding protein